MEDTGKALLLHRRQKDAGGIGEVKGHAFTGEKTDKRIIRTEKV